MVNKSRLRHYLLSATILPVLLGLLILSGCEESDQITGTGSGLSSAWTLIDLDVDESEFRAVTFISNDKGFLVGQQGAVLATTNGGSTWQKLDSPTDGILWDIEFLGDTGIMVGDDATVLRSIDGGSSWNAPVMGSVGPGINDIFGLDIASSEITWIVGPTGMLAVSTNAGWNWSREAYYLSINSGDTNWVTIGDPGTFEDFHEVDFYGVDKGVVVGNNGTIVITADSGRTWSNPTTNPATEDLYSIARSDATTLITVGDGGAIYRSTDDGDVWSAIGSFTDDLRCVTFANATNGWITGLDGTILTTSDAGATWTAQTSPTHLDLWGVSFPSATVGWIAGEFSILTTSTSGTTWSSVVSSSIDVPTLLSVDFIDANNGWAVGHGGCIVLTTNGGTNWSLVQHGHDYWLHDVEFVSATEGWAVGGQGVPPYHAIIQHSTDGGLTWTEQTNLVNVIDTFKCSTEDTTWIMDLEMIGTDTGFAVGGKWGTSTGGLCLETTDGGVTWTRVTVLPDTIIAFVAPGDPCNPGQSDDTVVVDRADRINAIHFADADNGWAVGAAGMIVHTSDGGVTWERQHTQWTCVEVDEDDNVTCLDSILVYYGYLNYDLNDVYFTSATSGWAVGSMDSAGVNVVLSTNDGGITWTSESFGSGVDISDIEFVDGSSTIGWMVGTNGVTFTTSDGATWSEIRSGAGDLTSVKPITGSNVWVVGEDGLLLQTTTGGH